VHQWNLALQKQLFGNWLLSATYLGNKTTHLWLGREINPAVYIPDTCQPGQYGLTKAGPCSTTANTEQRRVLILANAAQGKYYGSIQQLDDGGNSDYNALLVAVKHRFAQNFTVLANYTLSHCIDDGEENADIPVSYPDPNNRASNHGNCGADLRHVFNGTFVAQAPKFANSWMQRIASYWQLSGILTASSGAYGSVSAGAGTSADTALTGVGQDRAIVVGNPSLSNPTYLQWFNTKAFARASTGVSGNAGKNTILLPGQWNLDTALSRSFALGERRHLDFRGEAFNVLNHTNFGPPNLVLGNINFGKSLSTAPARVLQVAMKFVF
jgi:hypothetical protein